MTRSYPDYFEATGDYDGAEEIEMDRLRRSDDIGRLQRERLAEWEAKQRAARQRVRERAKAKKESKS